MGRLFVRARRYVTSWRAVSHSLASRHIHSRVESYVLVRRVTLLAAGLSLTLNLSAGGERWRARSNQPIFAHNTAVSARTRP